MPTSTPPVRAAPFRPDRRTVLSGFLALPIAATAAGAVPAGAAPPSGKTSLAPAPRPAIVRRSEWGGDLPPRGPIPAEDVRFLLVHHTAEPGSDYSAGEVPGLLRGIYRFHTGASKGWPDIAYNFFVDKFGTIYEGRTGSIDGPVRGSATGGNQGFSQLCCFVGNFEAAPPPAPALASMYSLLAWLADRYQVDTSPGATVSFTSMGSNRWPAGSTVEAATISAHRDMSQTSCPGTACYTLVRSTFPQEVTARRGTAEVPTTTPSTAAPPPSTVAPPPTTTTAAAPSSADPTTTSTRGNSTGGAGDAGDEIAATTAEGGGNGVWPVVAAVAVLGVGVASGAVAVGRRRARGDVPGSRRAATIAWRVAGESTDPLLHALATASRPAVEAGGDWWDDLSDHWRVTTSVGAGTAAGAGEPSSFLVASDGERALVRLVGDASGTAVLSDGSTSELTRDGLTKVWLTSAAVRLVLDGTTTELSADGLTGPVDRTLDRRR